MTLHFYFARRFAISFLILTIVLFSLVALVDLVDQARDFGDLGVSFGRIVGLTLLKAPETVNEILPLIMMLATIVLFVGLARSSELVATRAAGRSGLRALLAPVAVALAIGVLAVTTLNPIVAGTSRYHSELAESYWTGGASSLSISGEGLWLRQGGPEGQTVIRAWQSNADASVLYDVTFLSYAPDGGPVRRIAADSAALENGGWSLRGVKLWPLDPSANAEANSELHDEYVISTTLTLDRIRDSLGRPSAISIWALPEFITQLDQAGFSSRQHRVWFQSELARPLFLMSMVLVASAFTMRHTRFGGTGIAVLAAVLLGFGLYFIRSFAQILGENGQIPIALAAWAPPVASVMLALGLLLHAEDG
ncbi:LPS export ABC transporter permease LptG [Roseobacter sinensis]|uniref:LPS export ABC transporter permease LptG n=1 Tax=Roseobacter sinensis TaxID=2931391 RepID=A0ABT3BEC4_9RHOB|nr:LPS export ABC transporter permease LptG [Roseobacter sp. WL0113]MCV3271926.1 LPS export ABC transporter permease LptG [Roseobacter sp. WL0113]